MRQTWARLGGQLGLGFVAVGLLVIGLAWNGAASIDFVSGQVPYLLSGGALGLGFVAVGLLVIGLAWNGAASIDFVSGQVPYLLSGGALGLGLIVLGAAMIVVQNSRRDRAMVEEQLKELNTAIGRLANAVGGGGPGGHNGGGPKVVLGRSSYHRPECRLAQGKDLPVATIEAAEADGLNPCRICTPDELEAVSSR